MVWHHDSLQCVLVLFGLSGMVVQTEDRFGDCLVLVGHVSLGLNGAYLGELVRFEVSRVLLEVVPVESRDLRRKRL